MGALKLYVFNIRDDRKFYKMATIVIAIDESKFAQFAFKWYAEHLHKDGYRIILFHALENLFMKDLMGPGRHEEFNVRTEKKTAALREMYTKLAQELKINPEIRIEIVDTKPEHAIVDVANKENAKFIVTGTRGMGAIRRTILGSTSEFIMHHARCPVIICKMD
ncbi:universal stress protein in QAH/OAS sulfhydrylase 3'region-like [Saccostrea cucullata]|uniref:universal stress protein in QAH/OAS sulfhydrylase 3'region-like n=1 Tax=Saccostrea cuccullata TaxID=36930 RepID=UPI002ED2CBBE